MKKKKKEQTVEPTRGLLPSSEELLQIADHLRESERILGLPPLGGWYGRPEAVLLRFATEKD